MSNQKSNRQTQNRHRRGRERRMRMKCHDCGCEEGQIHKLGCDTERCPFCGGQLICCSCVYTHLNIDCSPGCWAYENGLTRGQEIQWLVLLQHKGRVPYIQWPNMCGRCGALWPEFFTVPDEEWNKYIQIDKRNEMLCRDCWNTIKALIDTN